MNNKDTLSTNPSKSQLKRQRTAAATINARDDSASGQQLGSTSLATSVRSPSIKKSMNRNFTRGTIAHTASKDAMMSTRERTTLSPGMHQSFNVTLSREENKT